MWKDLLKKNTFSLACGVIALLAVIASFWPADDWIADLQKSLQNRATVYTTLTRLESQSRTLPNIHPDNPTPLPLKVFPSKSVIDQGTAATKEMKVVSGLLFDTAVRLNSESHPVLVPNALPRSEGTTKFNFGAAYRLAFELSPENAGQQLPPYNIPVSILNATQPPSPEDITRAQDELWDNTYQAKIVTVNGTPVNIDQVNNDYTTEALKLPEVMQQQKARQYKTYLLPGALTEATEVEGSTPASDEQIWSAQLGLWIQTDVANAIAAANAPSKEGILDAAVKRVVQILVTSGLPTQSGSAARPGEEETGLVVSDPAAELKTDYSTSPTGRISNGLYDVYDFQLTIDVDSAQLPVFLTELTRNRFITVRTIELTPLNLQEINASGFMYGSKPVVQAELHCETLFLRKWTEPLMPSSIKKALGIAPPPQSSAMAR
jgi:hypothetical protein